MNYAADLSEGREDWRDVLELLEAKRQAGEEGEADGLLATLERISRWTGDTAG